MKKKSAIYLGVAVLCIGLLTFAYSRLSYEATVSVEVWKLSDEYFVKYLETEPIEGLTFERRDYYLYDVSVKGKTEAEARKKLEIAKKVLKKWGWDHYHFRYPEDPKNPGSHINQKTNSVEFGETVTIRRRE